MDTWKHDRIGSAERGENPTVLARLPSGFAVLGDSQFLPGYCLLLRLPKVRDLTDLPLAARLDFLRDMSLLGEAVTRVCRPWRINYEIFGNTDPFLHAHILPRYAWESADAFARPAYLYSAEHRKAPEAQFSEGRHGELKAQITAALRGLTCEAGIGE
ncbi:MAG TPA: HIT domain-containing protein [Thermomicrobiales bacterium]